MKPWLAILLLMSLSCFAQETNAPSAPPAPCTGEKYRQFDFWIGEWNVSMNGKAAGTNSIRPIHNGCVLEENWKGAGGTNGSSYNIYDQSTGRWHQTWVDNSGSLLGLDGGLEDGRMVLTGETRSTSASGKTTQRITWTPNPDGTVRQLWESTEDGVTWSVMFDGLYEKVVAD